MFEEGISNELVMESENKKIVCDVTYWWVSILRYEVVRRDLFFLVKTFLIDLWLKYFLIWGVLTQYSDH